MQNVSRRHFLQSAGAIAAVAGSGFAPQLLAQAGGGKKIKLGYDNFAVRAMGWKAAELIRYADSLQCDSLLISDLMALESFDDSYLRQVKEQADRANISLHLGTWSICPTSKSFKNQWGTAEEHLGLSIRVAKALGSPVIRVILGNMEDRRTPGGIQARIEDTVKVCKALKNQAVDAGVKIAMENHAGDMQAREVVMLIEAAGKDFVGANMDSGNAAWTLEDPLENLEILGPYALTTSLRDSSIWKTENGCKIQWAAMGEGQMDLKKYFARYSELCPHVPVHIETISGFAREFPYLKTEFWESFPLARAAGFARFLALVEKGKPHQSPEAPKGKDSKETEQLTQKGEVERSLKYCREVLNLGIKS